MTIIQELSKNLLGKYVKSATDDIYRKSVKSGEDSVKRGVVSPEVEKDIGKRRRKLHKAIDKLAEVNEKEKATQKTLTYVDAFGVQHTRKVPMKRHNKDTPEIIESSEVRVVGGKTYISAEKLIAHAKQIAAAEGGNTKRGKLTVTPEHKRLARIALEKQANESTNTDHVYMGAKVHIRGNEGKGISKEPLIVHKIHDDQQVYVKDDYGNSKKVMIKDLVPHTNESQELDESKEAKEKKVSQLKNDYKNKMRWSEESHNPSEKRGHYAGALKIKNHLKSQYGVDVNEDRETAAYHQLSDMADRKPTSIVGRISDKKTGSTIHKARFDAGEESKARSVLQNHPRFDRNKHTISISNESIDMQDVLASAIEARKNLDENQEVQDVMNFKLHNFINQIYENALDEMIHENSPFDWKKGKSEIQWNNNDEVPGKSDDGKHIGTYGSEKHKAPSGETKPKNSVGRPKGEYVGKNNDGKYNVNRDQEKKLAVGKNVHAGRAANMQKETEKAGLNWNDVVSSHKAIKGKGDAPVTYGSLFAAVAHHLQNNKK